MASLMEETSSTSEYTSSQTPHSGAVAPIHGPTSSGNLAAVGSQAGGPAYSTPHLLVSDGVPDLRSPYLYLNRELSWLEFNARVLAEGENEAVPLLERLKFHAIFASNLDEFFMVRVAGLKQQMTGEVGDLPPDGMTPAEQLSAVSLRVHAMVAQQAAALETQLLPRLAEQGTLIVAPERLSTDQLAQLDQMFHNEIFPILTPIAVDPGHPFPHLRNKSLNIGVMFAREGEGHESGFGVVQVPVMLPRLIEITGVRLHDGNLAKHAFVLLEALIARHVGTIFPGVRPKGVYTFRVTRNFDLELDEEEAEDLLQMIQQELRRRERGNAVRLEVAGEPTPGSLMKLVKALKLDPERDVYRTSGMLNMSDLMRMVSRDERRELRDEPFAGYVAPPLRDAEDLFAVLREQDVVLQHPYDSYDTIVDFITRAADDPDVLAIKQTLYRAGGDSPIIKALTRAAEAGKQVTAIVELKARFDEESNIQWARTLEQAGVNVVYGLLGLKTHAKCLLIVRREKGKLRRYVHLATGNYNPGTAKMYTDVSLLTCKPQIGEDASSLFNLLTGYSAPPKWNSLIVAPLGLHEAILGLIQRETEHAQAGRPARIIAKMNALVDEDVIEALYRASQAGVSITLLVRGICCLRPGVPKVSDTIEVRAIVDRFLEHGRVLYFANGGKDEVFIASADWMPRNFHRRVELLIPIDDPTARTRLIEVLHVQCADNVKSWFLRSDGSYARVAPPAPGQPAVRAQQRFMELARDRVKIGETAGRPSRFHLQTMPARQLDAPRVRRRREAPPAKK